MSDSHRSSGWHRYWQENRLAACVPDNPASAALIETHWSTFFAALPTGSRVLDVATGNGVLMLWARGADRGRQPPLELTGVDLADIDPARYLSEHSAALASVDFRSNVAAEALPFNDGSFDVVVSQYGLEYAELAPALTEVARVLAPGGCLHWLAHDDASIVVRQGAARLEELELLLAADGPFVAMQGLVEAEVRGRRQAQATEALTRVLKNAEAYCAAHPSAGLVRQLCGAILATANSLERYRLEDVLAWLAENRERLRAQRERVRDLQSASLNEARLARVDATLSSPPWRDLSVTPLELPSRQDSVGRIVHAVKSSPS